MSKLGLVVVVLFACSNEEKPPASAPSKPAEAERAEPDRELAKAKAAQEAAEAIAHEAVRSAKETREVVERLEHDMDEMAKQLNEAIAAVATAHDKAAIDDAKARLAELQKERAEMQARIAEAKAAAAKAARTQGSKISKECQDNPLAKGCM